MINDLIGLGYELGARYSPGCSRVDCFALFCEVRRRLGLTDYEDQFRWAYEKEKLPTKAIIREIRKIARLTEDPQDGDAAIIGGGLHQIAIGTVINNGILTIAHGSKSFWAPSLLKLSFYSSLQEQLN